MPRRRLRIFISSPGDVGLEREICGRVVDRLQGKFGSHFELETGMGGTSVPRDRDVPGSDHTPSETDVVICILWSRLGTPLSEEFHRPDGTRYGSGTEWEFEDAAQAYRERGKPDLLVYRRTQVPEVSLKDEAVIAERRAQYRALEAFVSRWFFHDDGTFKGAFKTYEHVNEFERRLEGDLQQLLLDRIARHGETEDDLRPTVHWTQGSPFLGLNAFDFGTLRGVLRTDPGYRRDPRGPRPAGGLRLCGAGRLRHERLRQVVAGVAAGVVATITRPGVVEGMGPWRWCQFRPSDSPDDLLRGLASAILADGAALSCGPRV